MPLPVATSFLALSEKQVNNVMNRASANVLMVTVAAIVGFTILTLVAVHVRAARTSFGALSQQCNEDASAFRPEADNLAAGSKVVGYQAHYNLQRHECLIQITSSRPEDGGEANNEQIFDPSDGAFVASRDSVAGVRTAGAIVMGAPVPIQKEGAAQAWFNDLMRK
jgi:hypothetical protein